MAQVAIAPGGVVASNGVTPPAAPAAPKPSPAASRLRSLWAGPGVAGAVTTALTMVSALCAGLVLYLVAVSPLVYERHQDLHYAELRSSLARGTTPVGQTFIEIPPPPADQIPGEEVEQEQPQELLVAPGTPIALLEIPAIGLDRAVVLEGTSSGVLQEGPGHQRNSVMPGQDGLSVIYGRAWSHGAPFGDLSSLESGDAITVTTGQGVSEFRVTGIRRPGSTVPPARPRGTGRLTLVSAQGAPYFAEEAVYVDAELVGDVQPTPALRRLQLDASEAPLQGDTGGLLPVFLWSQALLVAALGITYLRVRWGGRQAWVVGVPVLAAVGIGFGSAVSLLLPNLT